MLKKLKEKKMLIIASLVIFFIAQAIAWLQINGQFVWPWMKDHRVLVSLSGVPISYLLMLATDLAYEGMDGKIWPGRLLAFGMGMLVFTLFTSYFLGEGINMKAGISLVLATALLILQLI
jgi:hypothetical protein